LDKPNRSEESAEGNKPLSWSQRLKSVFKGGFRD
jgi:hypothetical protein